MRRQKRTTRHSDPEIHFDIIALATDFEGAVRRQLSEHFDALFLRKLTDWRSEHEFRFIAEQAMLSRWTSIFAVRFARSASGPIPRAGYFLAIRRAFST